MQFGLDSRLQPTLEIKDCLGSFRQTESHVTSSLGEVQQIEIPRPGDFFGVTKTSLNTMPAILVDLSCTQDTTVAEP